MVNKTKLLISLLLAALVLLSACAGAAGPAGTAGPAGPAGPAGKDATRESDSVTERQYYVTVAEIKGYTSGIGPPEVNPKDLSDGYGFYPAGTVDPERPDRWGVAAYFFMPASMVAYQGDKVSLTIIVLNGDEHTTWLEGPDGGEAVPEFIMNRGRVYELSFTASEIGTYILHCDNHDPTMTAYIQVFPR